MRKDDRNVSNPRTDQELADEIIKIEQDVDALLGLRSALDQARQDAEGRLPELEAAVVRASGRIEDLQRLLERLDGSEGVRQKCVEAAEQLEEARRRLLEPEQESLTGLAARFKELEDLAERLQPLADPDGQVRRALEAVEASPQLLEAIREHTEAAQKARSALAEMGGAQTLKDVADGAARLCELRDTLAPYLENANRILDQLREADSTINEVQTGLASYRQLFGECLLGDIQIAINQLAAAMADILEQRQSAQADLERIQSRLDNLGPSAAAYVSVADRFDELLDRIRRTLGGDGQASVTELVEPLYQRLTTIAALLESMPSHGYLANVPEFLPELGQQCKRAAAYLSELQEAGFILDSLVKATAQAGIVLGELKSDRMRCQHESDHTAQREVVPPVDLSLLTTAVDNLRAKHANLNQAFKAQQGELAGLRKAVAELQESTERQGKEIDTLKTSNRTLSSRLRAAQQEINAVQDSQERLTRGQEELPRLPGWAQFSIWAGLGGALLALVLSCLALFNRAG